MPETYALPSADPVSLGFAQGPAIGPLGEARERLEMARLGRQAGTLDSSLRV